MSVFRCQENDWNGCLCTFGENICDSEVVYRYIDGVWAYLPPPYVPVGSEFVSCYAIPVFIPMLIQQRRLLNYDHIEDDNENFRIIFEELVESIINDKTSDGIINRMEKNKLDERFLPYEENE